MSVEFPQYVETWGPFPRKFQDDSHPLPPPNPRAMTSGDYLLSTRDDEVSRLGHT